MFREIDQGYINAIYAVGTPVDRYVMRIYREPGDLSRIRHEHAVALRLQQAGLSFRIPAPIPTANGETLATVAGPEGETYVALIPFLPGAHPDFRNLRQAEAAGAALGELVSALGSMEPDATALAVPAYGDLAGSHPEFHDPLSLLDWLPVEPAWRTRFGQVLESVLVQAGRLYGQLPRQMTHGDFTHGNVLMEGDRVTGVLDFEFSAWALRVMDYAIGIGGGPKSLRSGWEDWDVLASFSRGYFAHHHLTEEELEALPDLIRLRRAYFVLRFAERYRLGLETAEQVRGMTWWALNAEDWLEENGAELVRRAKAWASLSR